MELKQLWKMIRRMKKAYNLFFCILLLMGCNAFGQQFRFECKIPKVDSTAYYRIAIIPSLNAKLNDDAGDLRIYEGKKEIPYLLKADKPSVSQQQFRSYEIVSKQYLKDSLTLIVIKRSDTSVQHPLVLIVKKAEVQKEISISGSNDQNQWYVLKNRQMVIPVSDDASTTSDLPVNLPPSDYPYYRVEINDRNSGPVSVEQAGYYVTTFQSAVFQELKITFTVSDSANTKSTWLSVVADEPVQMDQIVVDIGGPDLYLRKVILYTISNNKMMQVGMNELKSGVPSVMPVQMKTAKVYLQIMNDDNQPLSINALHVYQYKKYAIANLEKDKEYFLRFGDSLLENPVYDLEYFRSSISGAMPVIIPGEIIEKVSTSNANQTSSFFSSKRILWVVIIIVITFLAFVTRRMIKNM
jgi:hypothetical protein